MMTSYHCICRPYKVPTFEEIFERDHSPTTEAANQIVLNLKQKHGGLKFPTTLSENYRTSQIEPPSDLHPKLSSKKYLYEEMLDSSPKMTSTTVSYEEIRKQKLLELAKQELLKKQRLKSQRIKNQQKQEKFLKLTKYLQQQKKKSVKTPRSQQLDNFFTKIQGFSSSKTSQFKPGLMKKVESLIKKSDQEEDNSPDWRQTKINGQQYLDKSWQTKILDESLQSGLSQIAAQRHPAQSSRHDVVTTGEDIITLTTIRLQLLYLVPTTSTTTTTTTITPPPTTPSPPSRRIWTGLVESENETENDSSHLRTKEPKRFTESVCASLRVPCRFVTEHPCCSLPQGINMMAR